MAEYIAWNKCFTAGSNYCQWRNKSGQEKKHTERDLGFAKAYCQDALNKTSCVHLPNLVYLITYFTTFLFYLFYFLLVNYNS